MSNFKSGSGNLDFGGKENVDEEEKTAESANETASQEESTDTESSSSDHASSASTPSKTSTETTDQSASNREATTESAGTNDIAEQYPYFIRRSNVGDERGTRLEIHVRDKVADHEAEFRNELANSLGVNEVSKTDAREFALLAAFQHPEQVAELMREEGFGTLG